jgi:hypothetical protein
VLDDVARPPQRSGSSSSNRHLDEKETSDDYADNKASTRSEHESEVRRREDQHDNEAGSGFDTRGHVRQTELRSEAQNARAVLHIADLERIVSAVRTQLNSQGRREVLIELRRSALEGLRVKLSADEAGRVTAEFIASSERVKTQIDARSAELSELLRSRGINLAALKTSVGADSSGAGNAENESRSFAPGALSAAADSIGNSDAADAAGDDSGINETGRTYRA